jgi:hypothetical protein
LVDLVEGKIVKWELLVGAQPLVSTSIEECRARLTMTDHNGGFAACRACCKN